MKKLIAVVLLIAAIMMLTGCSKKEEAKTNDSVTSEVETVVIEDNLFADLTVENSLEEDYKDGKVSKEYYEEMMYNSQTNNW